MKIRHSILKSVLTGTGFAGLLLLVTACNRTPLPARTELCMGTVCTVNLYQAGTEELYNSLFQRLNDIEAVFSVNLPGSEISAVNRNAGIAPVAVSDEVRTVLKEACKYAEATGGAFDPTVGPLVDLWGIGGDASRIPDQAEIDAALDLVDYRLLHIDDEAGTVFLPVTGMKLDLGGIVKGYAADELVEIVTAAGIKTALFDLGGNIYAFGVKEDGSPWRVGIKNPQNPAGQPVIRLEIDNMSVVTSGVYERYFEQDGIRYHHILDTTTGYPVWNHVMSATIISPSSLQADALSTSLFMLGPDAGMELLSRFQTEGIIIRDDNTVTATPGIAATMALLDSSFTLQ